MITAFIEATNGERNWGKFMVGRFTAEEWGRGSHLPGYESSSSLLGGRGWDRRHIIVVDLQTGEGARFLPGGLAKADLDKHKIWVCPMFEPFLTWLYRQDLTDLEQLPKHIDIPDAEFAFAGYRRGGQVSFTVWCQGGEADGYRYETAAEPDDVIYVDRGIFDFVRVTDVMWPGVTAYERQRAVEQFDHERIYYPKAWSA